MCKRIGSENNFFVETHNKLKMNKGFRLRIDHDSKTKSARNTSSPGRVITLNCFLGHKIRGGGGH